MGNRAVLTFDNPVTEDSVGIYLHWNGGAESVIAFIEAAGKLGVNMDDPDYRLARLVQIIGNFFGGSVSIGVDTLKHLDTDNGNNGVFQILCKEPTDDDCRWYTLKQSKDGSGGWTDVDVEDIRSKSSYWNTKNKNGTPKTMMLDDIIKVNKDHFRTSL